MPHVTISAGALERTRTRIRRARRSAAWRLAGRALLALRVAPLAIRIVLGTAVVVGVWAAVNWMVQVARKPAEVFFPVSGSLAKHPSQTWREYGVVFASHSTAVITPELLAALAQVEGRGNPVDGPWHDVRSCWFNALYTRVVPGHSAEMTAALLDRTVARTLGRNRITTASLRQRQDLAAVIHLCGSGAGNTYARRGFRLRRGQR